MSLTQKEVNELYSVAIKKAEGLSIYTGTIGGFKDFRDALYIAMRYHYINKYNPHAGYRYVKWHERSPLARLFKKDSLFAFGTYLSKETAMLNKVLDQVTNEYFSKEDRAMFDIQSMVKNMGFCVTDIESINKEGESVSKELAKIPHFLETGRWD